MSSGENMNNLMKYLAQIVSTTLILNLIASRFRSIIQIKC